MTTKKFKVFSDFDGTITKMDVGNLIFKTFAGEGIYSLIESWKKNEISSSELLKQECELAHLPNIELLNNLIDKQSIDDDFHDFVKLCNQNSIEIFILSDGMDYYIDRILNKNNLSHLPFYSNKFNYISNDDKSIKIDPQFPYTDSECTKCGNCKRNHLLYHQEDEEIAIYIGDGYSDRCPAEFADIVFCKGQLLSYCTAQKIPFIEFRNFGDIILKFQDIISRKRITTKRRAELKRKEVLLQG